jgi:AraC family transcriptional regulator, regulatory protein of adaptative response / methylated-DNA-[protein]-cysteine methyltransferase
MESESQWKQVLSRDARQDGRFVFAVRTTGVYCRPSCPSRRPRRDSVEFFASPQAAERAGYRACLRCKPTQTSEQAQHVIRARQLLDNSESTLTLAELSKRVGVSAFHLQRLFKRATGLSPREYQAARRTQQVKSRLRAGADVTTSLYDAGYGSPSRLYEVAGQQLGMTPATYGRGGSGERIGFTVADSPLGKMLVAATQRGICAVSFGADTKLLERDLRQEFHAAHIHRDDASLQVFVSAILTAFSAQKTLLDVPLDIRATAFQQKVWSALRQIPVGETRSYLQVARSIGDPSATRAVARACASNPVALAIPCHRVIRDNGELAGYRWGVQRKEELLRRERVAAKAAKSGS